MFDQLDKRIVYQRHRYFPNDPQNLVSVSTEKVITSNTRRNPTEIMAENVAFATKMRDNSEYPLNENARLRKEHVPMKQQGEHLATENQQLYSESFNIIESRSTI